MARSETISQREAPTAGRQVEPLTDIELKILDFMIRYLRANTYQPSIREIGEEFGIKSTKTVSEHLQAIAEKGFLERNPSRSRGVKILGIETETVSVPCHDTVSDKAGQGRQLEFSVSIDRRLGIKEDSFFIRARSGDLALLGVVEGDLIFAAPAAIEDLEDGSIIITQIGVNTLFHRLKRTSTVLHLEGLWPGGTITVVDDSTILKVIGRVTSLFRRMDDAAPLNLTPH